MTDVFIKFVFVFGFEQVHIKIGVADPVVAGGALRICGFVKIPIMEAVIGCGFFEVLMTGQAARIVDIFFTLFS